MTSKAILEWEDRVLNKYYLQHGIPSLSISDRQAIHEWLISDEGSKYHSRLIRLTVPMVLDLARKWLNSVKESLITETDFDIHPILEFANGFSWVKLKSSEAYTREGILMRHCVNHYANKPYSTVYSLRDKKNNPHCTLEVEDGLFEPSLKAPVFRINQISGKMNRPVPRKYRGMLIDLIYFLVDKGYSIEPQVYMRNNLLLKDGKLIDAESLSKVNGDLDLSFFSGEMPEKLIVNGNLILSYANPKKISKELFVSGKIFITNGFSIPQNWSNNSICVYESTIAPGNNILTNKEF